MNIYLHNILVSLSMVLFTVTQGTLSSPGESNYGFEDEVRIELGVPRILTTWIILTTSSFYLVLLRVDGIPTEVQGFPRPPLIWVVWLKLRHWPRTKFLECDLVIFSSSLSFSTFSVSTMFCWASSQIPLLPVSLLTACCRHPGLCFQLVSQLSWQVPNWPSQHCRFSAQLILNAICSTAFLEHAGNLLNPLVQASG